MKIPVIILSAFWLLVTACGNTARLEIYFVQQGVFQYYIRSSEMSGGTGAVTVDFTFRDRKLSNDVALFNFTIASDEHFRKKVSAGWFMNADNEILPLQDLKLMFRDFSDKAARFTSGLTADDFRKLLVSKDVVLYLVMESKTNTYFPSPQLKQTLSDASIQILQN